MNNIFIKTMCFKIKPETYSWLNEAAIEVNQVFNYCNEASYNAIRRTDLNKKWMSGYDLCNLTVGSSVLFDKIGAQTVQSICTGYEQNRKQAKKDKLNWRISTGNRKSLGWIPFKSLSIKRNGNGLKFCGKFFRVFESKKLQNLSWKSGCFSQDSLGDWWLCLPIEVEQTVDIAPNEEIGIDLGLKSTATTSDGKKLETQFYRKMEKKIKEKQRRGHKKQAKRLHQKIKNQRKDALHKFTTKIVESYQNIIVGDVSSTKLLKTKMAKSVNDASWYMLKTLLDYKSKIAARSFQVVNERNTTKVCSSCGRFSGPSGLRQLSVREWTCACGDTHDRDVNAAKNILRLRYQPPSAGTNCSFSDLKMAA